MLELTLATAFLVGKSADIIAMVQALFNIDFKDAIARINYDFSLSINLYTPVDKVALKRLQNERELKKQQEIEKDKKLNHLCDMHSKFYKAVQTLKGETNKTNWESNVKAISMYEMEIEKINLKIE